MRQLNQNGEPESAITIHVADGNYQLSQPLELTRRDSGSPKPIVYRAVAGARPVFSGGRGYVDYRGLRSGDRSIYLDSR